MQFLVIFETPDPDPLCFDPDPFFDPDPDHPSSSLMPAVE